MSLVLRTMSTICAQRLMPFYCCLLKAALAIHLNLQRVPPIMPLCPPCLVTTPTLPKNGLVILTLPQCSLATPTLPQGFPAMHLHLVTLPLSPAFHCTCSKHHSMLLVPVLTNSLWHPMPLPLPLLLQAAFQRSIQILHYAPLLSTQLHLVHQNPLLRPTLPHLL